MLGSIVSNMIGDTSAAGDYQYLPPQQGAAPSSTTTAPPPPAGTIKDEIESRIDRKLDEIDRRLAEWRDKEIANRIRILKITLWASVVVGIVSLIYSYVQAYFPGR